MLNNGPIHYSDPLSSAGAAPSPITLAAAAATASVYVLTGSELSHEDILARIDAIPGVHVIKFTENTPDRTHRLVGTLDGANGTVDGNTGGEDVYGAMFGHLDGTLAVQLVKLFTHSATFSGTTLGGGREGGAQVLEKSASLSTTQVMEALTGGSIVPTAWSDGASSGWSLADIGPFRAIIRKPYKGTAAGVVARHQRWS